MAGRRGVDGDSSSQPSNDSGTLGKDSSVSDPSSRNAQRNGERWRNACHYHYIGHGCRSQACKYLHDLDKKEEASFRAWKGQNHVLYTESDPNSSEGKSGGSSSSERFAPRPPGAVPLGSRSPSWISDQAQPSRRNKAAAGIAAAGITAAGFQNDQGIIVTKAHAGSVRDRALKLGFSTPMETGNIDRTNVGAREDAQVRGNHKEEDYIEQKAADDSDDDEEPPIIDARFQNLFAELMAMDNATLELVVPQDEKHLPSSIGSILHADGGCEPCKAFLSSLGCTDGVRCNCCHLSHKHLSAKTKHRTRPCKGKRDRYQRLVSRIAGKIDEDPASFDVQDLAFPPSVAKNAMLKRKLAARLKLHADNLVSGCPGEGEPPIRPLRGQASISACIPAPVGAQPLKPGKLSL